ncbi:MAG: serine/threonine-protein kinase [Planctomycetota bacterium]|nr:serine/threonine-protein kinase [Planctomycetota bacterium]
MIKQLGPYRIIRVLGRGGMGTVYEGIHDETGQRAAIKALPLVLADDGNFRERFIGEIETLKQLKHPNIVELFGDGEQDGLLFYAMELVEGQTLQEELQARHNFEWPEVLRIGIEVCQALKHAHDHGIIHRDLKPANLLRTPDRQIKLLDFGIAKLFGATHLTADGSVVGTADYMAPEQAEGRPVSNRTDLFSLGAVMFTLLTRRPPFSGGSIPEVLHRLRYDDAPLVRRYAPSVPIELEEVIDQLLKKDAKDRIPTALVLANQLKAMEYGLTTKTVADHPAITNKPPQVSPNDQVTRESTVSHTPATEVSPTSIEPHAGRVPAEDYSWNDATVVTSGSPSEGIPVAPSSSVTIADPSTSQNRFTTLAEQRREQDRPSTWKLTDLAKMAALVTAIVGLLGFVAWRLLPPSADALYDQIATAAREGDLRDVTPEMEQFVAAYAADARSGEVRDWLLDIQSQYLFSRLRNRAMRATLTEVQQAYVEAMKRLETQPQSARDRLEALLSNFAEVPDEADPITCLEAARHQVKRLSAILPDNASDQ